MKLGAYAGIATPIVWFALLITAGALAPGYDPILPVHDQLRPWSRSTLGC